MTKEHAVTPTDQRGGQSCAGVWWRERVLRRLTVEGEPPHVTSRRVSLFVYFVVSTFLSMVVGLVALQGALSTRGKLEGRELYFVRSSVNFVVQTVLLVTLWFRPGLCGDKMFVGCLAYLVAVICLIDLNEVAQMRSSTMYVFVLLLDMMLVGRLPWSTTRVFIAVVVLYIAVIHVEKVLRFGLLDMWGSTDYDRRRRITDCERPPCPVPPEEVFGPMVLNLFVFLLDFFFTRRFAHAAEKEQRRMQAAVATANSVAAALARFDLEEAEASLAAQGGLLPGELYESFQTLIANLGTYKPYLPPSCLPTDSTNTMGRTTQQLNSDTSSQATSGSGVGSALSGSLSSTSVLKLPSSGCISAATNFVGNEPTILSKTITLLNVTAHLPPPSTPEPYAAAHERWLGAILACTRAERGVVDSFVGDHVTASFNAMRACAVHAVAALRTVHALSAKTDTGVCMTGAVGTGSACVGVLGTDTMLRQSVVGGLPGNVDELERFGDVCGYEWVCNKAAYTECRAQFALRVVLDSVVGGFGDVGCVYEVLAMDEDTSGSVEEWMYALERTKGNQFDAYNAAGALFVTKSGEGCADARLAGCQYLQSHDAEPEMVSMFEEAVERARVVEVRPRVVSGPGWPRGMRKKWLKNIAKVESRLLSIDLLDMSSTSSNGLAGAGQGGPPQS